MDENIVAQWRKELLDYIKEMADFSSHGDLGRILTQISSMTARASWMRQQVVVEPAQVFKRFRLDEVDPFLKEADRQFKVWSRMITIHSQEWQQSGSN